MMGRNRWRWHDYWYVAVTADRYELPLAVCETGGELARAMGVAESTVFSSLNRGSSGKNRGWRIVKVARRGLGG